MFELFMVASAFKVAFGILNDVEAIVCIFSIWEAEEGFWIWS